MQTEIPIFKTEDSKRRYMEAYGKALELWPVPFEQIDVQTRLGSTHAITSGEPGRPALLLLHGAGNSATMWYPMIKSLASDYRIYALDTIGDGGKSILCRAAQSRKDYSGWLKDFLDGIEVDKVSLVGLSYGGWLSLNLALDEPKRVDKLALLAPAASFLKLSFQVDFFLRYGHRLPFHPSIDSTIRWLCAPGTVVDKRYTAILDLAGRYGNLSMLFPDVYMDEELRRIQAQTLLIYGDREVIYNTKKAAKRARRLMPHVEVEFIRGAGHFLPMDQPQQIAASILRFLQK